MHVAAFEAPPRRSPPQRGSVLPLLLAVIFLVAGAMLFLTSTVPALRERDILLDKHGELAGLQARLEKALASWRGRERAMDEDIETLLVEIDKLGLLPEELVAGMHSPGSGAGGGGSPPQLPAPKNLGPNTAPTKPARSSAPPGPSKRP